MGGEWPSICQCILFSAVWFKEAVSKKLKAKDQFGASVIMVVSLQNQLCPCNFT